MVSMTIDTSGRKDSVSGTMICKQVLAEDEGSLERPVEERRSASEQPRVLLQQWEL